ncbi:MAG: glutamine synthetase III [Bacteroidetes bacterium]|nr:glutamine synthetase III [Bacteroidota bacterium]
MDSLRFKALEIIQSRSYEKHKLDKIEISDIFGSLVFNEKAMRKYLAKDSFKGVKNAIESGEKISRKVADEVAGGMKSWAIERGATHYTHWFQPLTGTTAEKHDSFFELKDGDPIEGFSAGALVQQEPDASSFPSGGIRNTFEARGYTAWDPSSPAFLIRSNAGVTLCIPTIFVSYTGEALDYKAPLLKALNLIENASVNVCRYFDPKVNKVSPTLGIEQEYFLVDNAFNLARPDLMLTGRTIIGHAPAKGQQLEDHYFGSIPERVNAFMVDFENEAYRLGIPLRTRHNEVAPAQYECAPQFEEVNIAVDHNQLLMDMMQKVALRHELKCILHEKPFAGVNGSGKHCNWSMGTDTGVNLLSPGDTPSQNLQFLTFFINTIKAVYDHADLLRASIASASNDHRLGANEAPPAIISVFIGEQLTKVLDEVEKPSGKKSKADVNKVSNVDVPKIPELHLDNTDRNRTSPFAFTGNKFEFRAVGSSSNTSSAMIVLNTIVANQLVEFKKEVDALIKKKQPAEVAIMTVLRQYVKDAKKILFEGNNYGDEWMAEAKKRGLSNIKTSPEALDAYISKKTVKLFETNKILSHRELEARHEILLEMYMKQIQIESRMMGEVALSQILPCAIEYQNELLLNYGQLFDHGFALEADQSKEYIQRVSNHINLIRSNVFEMIEERRKANKIDDARKKAVAYCHKVRPYFEIIRYHIDKLEMYVDDKLWPIPKYREMLFMR